MGGYAPHTRQGLIALIAMRRIKAEKMRRAKLAATSSPAEAETVVKADRKQMKTGWFRR